MTGRALRSWERRLEMGDPEELVTSTGKRLVLAYKKPRMGWVSEMGREGVSPHGGPAQA